MYFYACFTLSIMNLIGSQMHALLFENGWHAVTLDCKPSTNQPLWHVLLHIILNLSRLKSLLIALYCSCLGNNGSHLLLVLLPISMYWVSKGYWLQFTDKSYTELEHFRLYILNQDSSLIGGLQKSTDFGHWEICAMPSECNRLKRLESFLLVSPQ